LSARSTNGSAVPAPVVGKGSSKRSVGPGNRNQGALDQVLELAHVAGPGVAQERLHDRLRHPLDAAAELGPAPLDDRPHQEWDVLPPAPERRNEDGEDPEPVVEVFAKTALGEGPGEIAVGGGEDSDVHLHGPDTADALELAGLEDAQKLGLKVQGEIADLVQEERASVRELEAPDLGRGGARRS
jgi:hypothetical protein